MKWILFLIVFCLGFSCTSSIPPNRRLPAEFEPTAAIWIQWDEGSYMGSEPIEHSFVEMMKVITTSVNMKVLIRDTGRISSIQDRLEKAGIDLNMVSFVQAWGRGAITDTAPVLVDIGNGKWGTVDFSWNNYGVREVGHPKTIDTDTFDVAMARKLGLEPLGRSELVWEGGAMDHNGRGTMLFAEQWMFQRNPGWTKAEIEAELNKQLDIKQVIWLKNGPAEDDFKQLLPGNVYPFGTGGHVDEFCRFADARTILLAEVSEEDRLAHPIHVETHVRMEENFMLLQKARDQDGNPFKIIRVPTPDLIIKKIPYEKIHPGDLAWFPGATPGDTIQMALATSYLNFVLTDKIVVAAKYGKDESAVSMKEKDEKVATIFNEIFKDKEIHFLNPEAFNHQGGGFHCYTYNEPARN